MGEAPTTGIRGATRRVRLDLPQRLGGWVVGLAGLALLAVLQSSPGTYVADNRFEQYWNPGRRLSRSLIMWDPSRGLGGVREELWPGATIPIGFLRLLGASPGLAEHLWHATLVATGGIGLVVLLRRYRPVLGPEHLLAALVYMFGPFSATFLLPSNLYLYYALVPWLLVVVHRGLVEQRPWRWAALAALWVVATGNVDPPGLVYSAVPVLILVTHLVAVERSVGLRRAASWLGRAAVLAALCSAAVLVKLVVGAGSFSARLSSTETPAAVSGASSWAESLRGMGFWVSYFADPFGLDRPQGRILLAVLPVVLLTFVPAIVALVTLARSRWRSRFLFGAFLVAGAFLMVGGYPPGAPPPWGRLWLDTLEASEAAAVLRSTYKAGSSLMLGMAVLFGVGVVEAVRAAAGARPALRHLPAVGAAVVLVAITSPFWTGSLYDPDQRLDAVAPHWREAIAWLDEQPGDDRVLFLPGGTRTAYRWGRPGDDVLDALLERPHASDMPISPTAPLAADVLRAVDDRAVDGSHRPGTMGPTLRRLGVEFVVLRNDLDWRRMGVPRPSAYDAIRDDEDLERVAAFGTLVDGDAVEELGEDEATLPALEVLRVRDHRSRLRVAAAEPPTIVSGSGSSWFTLARAGLLEEGSPVVYSATRTASQLAAALEGGARAVVTDGNRRQGVAVVSYDADASRLLARGEQLDRPVPELFTPRGSETVARFGDARRIAELTPARSLVGFQPQRRPALAFDGDEGTGWVSNGQFDQQGFRVDFAAPRVIDAIEVVGLEDAGARVGLPGDDPVGSSRIRRATVTLSDGTDLDVNLSTGRFEIRLQPTVTTSVELRIVDQTGAGAVGIAEMRFPGADLDLEEVPEVPDDLFRAAAASGDLARVLDQVGVDYAFERITGAGRVPEEPQLRRGFRSVGASRRHAVRGELARSRTLGAGCTDIGLSVDGRAVLVRAAASAGASTTAFVGCRDVALGDGHHVVRGDGEVLDLVVLSGAEGVRQDGEGRPLPVEDLRREPSSATLTIPAPDEAVLISGEAFDERWEAELDGDALGAPVPMDAQSGWLVPASAGERRVTLAFTPQRTLDISLLVSSVAVVGCLVCACRRTRP